MSRQGLRATQKPRVHRTERPKQAVEVLAGGIRHDIEVLGGTDVTVGDDRHAADDDEVDPVLDERGEESAKVEDYGRFVAAPLICVICRHNACPRASRSAMSFGSLIGADATPEA